MEEEQLQQLFTRMIGKSIVGVAIEDDAFVINLDDGTLISLYSDEDLSLYYELGESSH